MRTLVEQMPAPIKTERNQRIWRADLGRHCVHGVGRSYSRSWYHVTKSTLETGLAAVLLVLTSPVLLLSGIFVKLTSRGPVFYTQIRLGKNGEPYTIYKLRSMYHDCEKQSGPKWSTRGDSRITPLGRILRRCHIDELPQLWNVVRGDMNLIGPRPERPELVPQLERAFPQYRARLQVKPGITGLAQVQLPADEDLAGVRRKLAYDLYYVRHLSPLMDLQILVCTAFKVVGAPFPFLGLILSVPSKSKVEKAAYGESNLKLMPVAV